MKKHKPQTVAIIPARGGSKGIKKKNIQPLGNMPLIAYSIQTGLHCPLIDRVIVSTDDKEIATTAKSCGAEVPFLRPKELAGDNSSIGEAIDHTLLHLEGPPPEAVVVLLPTHPFRSRKLVEFLVRKTKEDYGQVRTVTPAAITPNSHIIIRSDQKADALWTSFFNNGGADQIPLQRFNGLFLAFIPKFDQQSWYTYNILDPIALIDIDYPEDLATANEVVRRNLFDFEN